MSENEILNSTTVDAENEYDASEIQVLEGLEAVRKRPGMYIGSTSSSGLHHLVYEIVDNAIDEALAGYCTDILVQINEGNTITVVDNGRGIPVDIQAQTGRPALEVVYTVLHAGGKFGGGGYKVSGGLHGVGASVVNALSEWLTVQVHRDGKIYEMKFSRGKITQEMTVVGTTDHTGTTVTFKPDPEMFEDTVYNYDTLHTRMREEAFLNAGLRIHTIDQRPGREQHDDMCYAGGIREFVTWLNRAKTPIHTGVIYMSGQRGDSMAELAFQYTDSYSETILSFAHRVFSAADLFRDIMLDFHITGGGVLLAVHTNDLPLGSVSDVEAKMVGPFSHKYYMASTEFVNTGGANLYIFLQICIEFIGLRRESGGKGFLSGGFVLQYIATI